jgi:hypothetical protein
MRSLTIQIPQPCHEPWSEMQPTEQGRFCASCQKTVIDYTALSDQELVRLLSQPTETTCGRFRNEQLNRPLTLSTPVNASVWRHWISLLTMGLFGWQTARAQLNQTSNLAQTTAVKTSYRVTALPIRASLGGSFTELTVTGKVMCMDSSGNLLPAAKAYVFVGRPGKNWQTQTDSTGAFTLSVSIPMQATEFTLSTLAPYHRPEKTTFQATPSTTSIVLNDIILHEPQQRLYITGGGMAIIKTPSRWQKFKRKLFH